ncbi:MAG: hypothetical protein LBU33_01480 [Endomicrobium sp.]|nr:hypothetical protein [Endomicrobium sp.]
MIRLLFILIISFLFLMSCSSVLLDYSGRVLGFSIEKFKDEKTGRIGKIFAMSKKECFDKSLVAIENIMAKVVYKSFEDGYIVAFNFSKSFDCCLDSTEVGIFIADVEDGNIKVEVISNNSLLSKRFSVKFFEMLIN